MGKGDGIIFWTVSEDSWIPVRVVTLWQSWPRMLHQADYWTSLVIAKPSSVKATNIHFQWLKSDSIHYLYPHMGPLHNQGFLGSHPIDLSSLPTPSQREGERASYADARTLPLGMEHWPACNPNLKAGHAQAASPNGKWRPNWASWHLPGIPSL